jgi:hypothetical protein
VCVAVDEIQVILAELGVRSVIRPVRRKEQADAAPCFVAAADDVERLKAVHRAKQAAFVSAIAGDAPLAAVVRIRLDSMNVPHVAYCKRMHDFQAILPEGQAIDMDFVPVWIEVLFPQVDVTTGVDRARVAQHARSTNQARDGLVPPVLPGANRAIECE